MTLFVKPPLITEYLADPAKPGADLQTPPLLID